MNKLYRNILILIFILILICYFLSTKKQHFEVQGISTNNLDKLHTLTSDNRADIAREILQSNELSDMLNPELENLRGARGPQGVNIDSARLNSEGNLILNMNDGTERKIHGVKGEQGDVKTVHGNVIRGPQGSPAPQVTKIEVKKINEGNDDEKNVLQFAYDDGNVFDTQTNIKGFKGEPCRGTTLSDTGNVGIGTSNPDGKLTVKTDASHLPTNINNMRNNSQLHLKGGGVGELSLGNWYRAENTGSYIQSHDDFNDNINGSNLLLNPSGGNIGIGTSNPKYKLDVNGDIRLPQKYAADGEGNRLLFHNEIQNEHGGFGEAGISYVGGPKGEEQQKSYLNFFTGNSSKMVIKKNGNVGIGTTSPNNKLDVSLTSDDGPGGIKISRKGGQNNSLAPTMTIKNTQPQNNFESEDGFKMQSKLKFEGPNYDTAEIRGVDSRIPSGNSSANQDVFRGDLEFWTKLHDEDGEKGLQKRMTINSEGNVIVEGGKICIGDTCLNEEELKAVKRLKAGKIEGNLDVAGNATIGNAYIGTGRAHGGWAEFSHKNRGAGGGDYSILSDAAGHTLLNSKGGLYTGFRNNNQQHAYVNNHGHIHTNSSIHANSTINTNAYVRTPKIEVGDINAYHSGKSGDIKDHNFIMRPSGGQIVSIANNGNGSIINSSRRNTREQRARHLEWAGGNAQTPLAIWGSNLTKHAGTGNYYYRDYGRHARWFLHY